MLHRVIIHIGLIVLFAFTQIGVVTHEISHLNETEQHQEEQHNHNSQCKQCLSDSHANIADLASVFSFELNPAEHLFTSKALTNSLSVTSAFYSARASPISQQ